MFSTWSHRFYTANTWTPAIVNISGQYVSSPLFQAKLQSSYVQPNPTNYQQTFLEK